MRHGYYYREIGFLGEGRRFVEDVTVGMSVEPFIWFLALGSWLLANFGYF